MASLPPLVLRLLGPGDDVAALTVLIHRAYARLGEMGLNYTAIDQDEETTRRRASRGACVVAEVEGRVVGTVAVQGPHPGSESAWHRRADACVLGQLAVEPALQGRGIGSALMDEAERRARESGAAWAVGDTAKPATHLITMYEARGYRIVDEVQWPGKTYRSVVLAKPLR